MNPQNTQIFAHWGWTGTIVAAVVILVLTAIVTHFVVKAVHKALDVATDGRVAGSIIENIIRVVLWVLGVGTMLYECLDFNPTVLWGALGIGGVALSLGLQTTVSNLLGGLQASLSKEMSIGDWISTCGVDGEVEDITWRKIVVVDEFGRRHNIPNSKITANTLTKENDFFKAVIPLSISQDCNVTELGEEVVGIAADVLAKKGMEFEGKKPIFAVCGTELGGISCTLLCFAKREFTTSQVCDAVMDAVLPFLRSRDALASYHN